MPATQQQRQRLLGHPKVAGANVSDLQAGKGVSISTPEIRERWVAAASPHAGVAGTPLLGIRDSGHAVHHMVDVKPCAVLETEMGRLQVSAPCCMAPTQHAAAPWHS